MDIISIMLSSGEYATIIAARIIRIVTIFLSGLGLTYLLTNQFGFKISNDLKNTLAALMMLTSSIVISFLYHYQTLAIVLWESAVFWLIGNVAYVIFEDFVHPRLDCYFDRKLRRHKEKKL